MVKSGRALQPAFNLDSSLFQAVLISALCSVVLMLAPAGVALADSKKIDIETGKLQELRASIGALKKQLDAVRGEHDSRQQDLEKTDRAIGDIRRKLRQLDRDADVANGKLATLEEQRDAARRKLAAMRTALQKELRAAWADGRQERIKLLLNQQDPADVSRMLVYQEYVARARTDRMAQFNTSLQQLQDSERAIEEQLAAITGLREEHGQQSEALLARQQEQRELVETLQQKLKSGGSELAQLEQDEKRVNLLVESLQKAMRDIPAVSGSQKSLHQLKGALPWPVAGKIDMSYGSRQSSGKLTSRGVHINAPAGSDVRAVARGRVAFADWLRGFGLLIIIDHGSGYMSLYGENSSLYKAVGEWVEQGAVIAAAGSSGGQPRAGVYLELRKNGQPINPTAWFSGKPVGKQARAD